MKRCDILKWSPKRGWSIIGEVSQWRVKTFKIVSQKRVVSHWRVVTLKRGLKTRLHCTNLFMKFYFFIHFISEHLDNRIQNAAQIIKPLNFKRICKIQTFFWGSVSSSSWQPSSNKGCNVCKTVYNVQYK